MDKGRPHDDKLVFLEIGRALAALIVVFHHADQATAYFSDVAHGRYFIWGQYGVDFFFVLNAIRPENSASFIVVLNLVVGV